MNATIRNLISAITVVGLSVFAQLAGAQNPFRTAGEKITGEAYWPARAATRHIQSARAYTQEYQSYIARAPRPEPAVVAEVQRTLGGYLDEADKHLASMKQDFADDQETVSAVAAIEKDLATAVEQHKAMIACCQDVQFDKAMAMSCCTDLSKSLSKIHDDHVALMTKLAQKHGAAAARK
jgi:hypothetical protein